MRNLLIIGLFVILNACYNLNGSGLPERGVSMFVDGKKYDLAEDSAIRDVMKVRYASGKIKRTKFVLNTYLTADNDDAEIRFSFALPGQMYAVNEIYSEDIPGAKIYFEYLLNNNFAKGGLKKIKNVALTFDAISEDRIRGTAAFDFTESTSATKRIKIVFNLYKSSDAPLITYQEKIKGLKNYHQSFDDFSFLAAREWGRENMNSCSRCPKSDNIPRLEIGRHNGDNCLKIAVYEQDGVYMHGNKNGVRSRSEVVYRPRHGDNSTFYYSWMIYIPDDSTFRDVEARRGAFHVIAQWHQANAGRFSLPGSQPPFKLSYKHEPGAAGHYRNLAINYGTHYETEKSIFRNSPLPQKRGFQIIDAIKKGEWTQITTKFHWSADDTGYMQMWINGKPCVVENLDGTDVLRVKQGPVERASKIFGPNLYVARDTDKKYPGRPVPNYLKFGHYRGYIKGSHTLYIDDFRVSSGFPDR